MPMSALSLNRRSLLQGIGAIALTQVLGGCQNQRESGRRIQFLQPSVPTALLKEFQQSHRDNSVQFQPVETLSALYDQLLAQQDISSPPSVVGMTLGDYWLTPAIRRGLIAPVNVQDIEGWDTLPPMWQELVKGDRQGMSAPDGTAWGAPYRWGSLVIAYQIEAFEDLGWEPTDWGDLWNPDISGQLALLDSPRTVIGMTLKRLGKSFNASLNALRADKDLSAALTELDAQVKLYSSSAYLQSLILGDVWVAVGWSTDILPLLRRDRRFAAVVPASGTALTADLWVRPSQFDADGPSESSDLNQSSESSLLSEWIRFFWQPEPAQRLSIQTLAASPVLVGSDRAQLPDTIRENPVLFPDPLVLDASEFLTPLPDNILAEYNDRWTEMRLDNLR